MRIKSEFFMANTRSTKYGEQNVKGILEFKKRRRDENTNKSPYKTKKSVTKRMIGKQREA